MSINVESNKLERGVYENHSLLHFIHSFFVFLFFVFINKFRFKFPSFLRWKIESKRRPPIGPLSAKKHFPHAIRETKFLLNFKFWDFWRNFSFHVCRENEWLIRWMFKRHYRSFLRSRESNWQSGILQSCFLQQCLLLIHLTHRWGVLDFIA